MRLIFETMVEATDIGSLRLGSRGMPESRADAVGELGGEGVGGEAGGGRVVIGDKTFGEPVGEDSDWKGNVDFCCKQRRGIAWLRHTRPLQRGHITQKEELKIKRRKALLIRTK